MSVELLSMQRGSLGCIVAIGHLLAEKQVEVVECRDRACARTWACRLFSDSYPVITIAGEGSCVGYCLGPLGSTVGGESSGSEGHP